MAIISEWKIITYFRWKRSVQKQLIMKDCCTLHRWCSLNEETNVGTRCSIKTESIICIFKTCKRIFRLGCGREWFSVGPLKRSRKPLGKLRYWSCSFEYDGGYYILCRFGDGRLQNTVAINISHTDPRKNLLGKRPTLESDNTKTYRRYAGAYRRNQGLKFLMKMES